MAVLAVGLCQEALPQRFLITTTASRVFQQPAISAIICVIRGENQGLLATISVN